MANKMMKNINLSNNQNQQQSQSGQQAQPAEQISNQLVMAKPLFKLWE
ncbi:hypothetical protein AB1K81_14675 [Ornithinibacillus sp. 179-J 7C1 HS]